MPSSTLPQRSLWIGLILAFLVAAGLRFSATDYALPYITHPDEPNFYRLAQDQRGVLEAGWRADWLAGYPPGYTTFYAAVVEGMNRLHVFDIHQDMAKVVGLMRLVNSLIDLITMALVSRLAGQLAGRHASVLVAWVFAVSLPFVENGALGLPDPLLTMLVTACAVCGLIAWQRDSVRWGLLSTGLGLLAIVVKYPAAPVLILPALFFLRQLYRRRMAALPGAVLALIMVLATAFGLWVVYGAGGLNNMESNQVRNAFVPNTLSPTRWFNVWKAIGGTLGVGLTLGALAALIGSRLLPRSKDRGPIVTGDLLLIGLTGLAILALVPGYLADIAPALYPVRYTLPAAGIVMAVAVALVVRLMQRVSVPIQIVIGLVCIASLLPDLAVYAMTLRLRNPYTDVQRWFETNVPDQSVIWMDSVAPYNSLSRYDRGYRGVKSFVGLFSQDNTITTPDLRESVDYIYLNAYDVEHWPYSQGWESLGHFTLIKSFSGPQYNTTSLSIYLPHALPRPQETVFTLGDVQLVLRGMEIEHEGVVNVSTYWQAPTARPTRDYSYSLYITPDDEPTNVIAQKDAGLGQRPTSTWDDPAEILPVSIGPLDLPAEVNGDMSLWLVIYDSQTGERFTLADGSTALRLETIKR